MEKQTAIPHPTQHLQQDCNDQIEAIEAGINRLKDRFQIMRERLEWLQQWFEPIDPPTEFIADPFIILPDEDEEGDTK
jgi:hypothetical protein